MDEQASGGTAFKVLGAGCSGLGSLLMVTTVVAFGLLFLEFFNPPLEEQVLSFGGGSLCCGITAFLTGLALIFVGRARA
jgi:hypothetical protein